MRQTLLIFICAVCFLPGIFSLPPTDRDEIPVCAGIAANAGNRRLYRHPVSENAALQQADRDILASDRGREPFRFRPGRSLVGLPPYFSSRGHDRGPSASCGPERACSGKKPGFCRRGGDYRHPGAEFRSPHRKKPMRPCWRPVVIAQACLASIYLGFRQKTARRPVGLRGCSGLAQGLGRAYQGGRSHRLCPAMTIICLVIFDKEKGLAALDQVCRRNNAFLLLIRSAMACAHQPQERMGFLAGLGRKRPARQGRRRTGIPRFSLPDTIFLFSSLFMWPFAVPTVRAGLHAPEPVSGVIRGFCSWSHGTCRSWLVF